MTLPDIAAIAARLHDAASRRAPTEKPSVVDGLTLADADRVQQAVIALRLARGERRTGVKLGFTSRVKMEQLGIGEVTYGRLTDAMAVADGGAVDAHRLLRPRIEPELAFRIAKPLSGKIDLETARDGVDGVAPALEIIDSRYRDPAFTLPDVIADTASAGRYCVGPFRQPAGDLKAARLTFLVDGTLIDEGVGAAILGDPWQAVIEAARLAGERGERLEPGWVLMAGAACAAIPLPAGKTVTASADGIGTVAVRVPED